MAKGLVELDTWLKNRAEQLNKPRQEFHKKLWFKSDGEFATVRVLTQPEDVFWSFFHRIPGVTSTGKTFQEERLCVGKDTCPICKNPDIKSIRLFLVWVYVYQHFYKEAGENRVPTKVGRLTYFVEDVNSAQLVQMPTGYLSTFVTKSDRYGTLSDRVYEFGRVGVGTSTSYVLTDNEISDMEPELVQLARELPDLETMCRDQAIRANASMLPGTSPNISRSGTVRPTPSRVAPSIDDDNEDDAEDMPF